MIIPAEAIAAASEEDLASAVLVPLKEVLSGEKPLTRLLAYKLCLGMMPWHHFGLEHSGGGCGPMLIAQLTGKNPNRIQEDCVQYAKMLDPTCLGRNGELVGVSEQVMRHALSMHGINMLSVPNLESLPKGASGRVLFDQEHILLLDIVMRSGIYSWAILYKNRFYHAGEMPCEANSPFIFLQNPVRKVYILFNTDWYLQSKVK